MIQPYDKFDHRVLISVCSKADGHVVAGVQRCDDGSLYAWCDAPGQGRLSIAGDMLIADGEAALDELLDKAVGLGALDLASTATYYSPGLGL